MFYYPNVLQRHTGCFSTIWLAATKAIRITRRELLRVNIGRTCEDIMDYVTVKVPPLHPDLPPPRFSLYLSSQLQYGVVIVYHRQCDFFLDEVKQTIERLQRSERYNRIDMAEPDRLVLDVPDSLFLLEEAEGAQDPFFGVMGLEHELPSPYKIPQAWQLIETATPQHSIVASPRITLDKEGFRSPPDAITLREEQVVISEAEYEGAELSEATAKEIDMLLEQQDLFPSDTEERERDREAEEERTRDLEGAMTSVDLLKDTVVGTDKDSLLLLDEQTGQPVEVPLGFVPMEMTPPLVAMPPAREGPGGEGMSERTQEDSYGELSQDDAPPKRRKRQLIFADPDVQISHDAMQEQIGNPLTETQPLSQVLKGHPSLTKALPAELFSAPSGSLLHPDLLSLWKQCAVLTTLPRSGERREEEEEEGEGGAGAGSSELDREMVRKEVGKGRKRRSSMREVPRELVESGAAPSEASAASELLLEPWKDDKSLERITPLSRRSLQEEAQVPIEPILEEDIEMPEREVEADSREITKEDLLRVVSPYLQRFGKVAFHALLPLEADRSTAAHMFTKLIELVSTKELKVYQKQSYGPITICPGA